jgi:hypothetical protein
MGLFLGDIRQKLVAWLTSGQLVGSRTMDEPGECGCDGIKNRDMLEGAAVSLLNQAK